MTAAEKRELDLEKLILARGAHGPTDGEFCAMEAVAFVAGEPHSDHPKCASPIISTFVRRWNDDLDDAGRQLLKPYIHKLVGTVASKEIEDQRGWLCADWLVRHHTAAWLELAGLTEHATALRSLPELKDLASLSAAQPKIDAARTKAAAASDAARAAARDAARAAASDAAWAAAWAAAWDAAWAAASDAAWDAAWAAAWAGKSYEDTYKLASEKLKPTQISLQASAFDLLDKMIALSR